MMGKQGPQRKQLSVCMYIQATVWANIYFSLLSVIFGGLNLIVAFEQGRRRLDIRTDVPLCMTAACR